MSGPANDSGGSFSNKENILTIIILVALILIYSYLLTSPSQPHLAVKPRNFVLQPDTRESFKTFCDGLHKYDYSSETWFDDYNYTFRSNDSYSSNSYGGWGKKGHADDFFMDAYRRKWMDGSYCYYGYTITS